MPSLKGAAAIQLHLILAIWEWGQSITASSPFFQRSQKYFKSTDFSMLAQFLKHCVAVGWLWADHHQFATSGLDR